MQSDQKAFSFLVYWSFIGFYVWRHVAYLLLFTTIRWTYVSRMTLINILGQVAEWWSTISTGARAELTCVSYCRRRLLVYNFVLTKLFNRNERRIWLLLFLTLVLISKLCTWLFRTIGGRAPVHLERCLFWLKLRWCYASFAHFLK